MTEPQDAFSKLLGTLATDAEKQELLRVLDALDIRRNDALLTVLCALQYYRVLYREIPGQIAAAAESTLSQLKQAAEASLQASAERTKEDLAQQVKDASFELAKKTAQTRHLQWLGIGFCSAVLAVCVAGWIGYSVGKGAGLAQGYAEARDEEAAASWAATPDGKLAHAWSKEGTLHFAVHLARSGVLGNIVRCEIGGWQIKDGYCVAGKDGKGKSYGWKVP